jgi:predicted nucleic-acid-binding Zn-ribbon protein
MQDGICPKCDSTEIYRRPMRRKRSSSQPTAYSLSSYLCRTCGYLETYMHPDQAAAVITAPAWVRVPLVPATGETIRLAHPQSGAQALPHEALDLALDRVCPVCGAETIIPDVRIRDTGQGARAYTTVEVERFPDALLFKEPVIRRLRARICGSCGYTALFADHPQDLYEAHNEAS